MGLNRWVLYRLATSDRLEGFVHSIGPVEGVAYRQARRYVAGKDRRDAVETVRRLAGEGLAASVDYFGEGLSDVDGADAVVSEYSELWQDMLAVNGDTHVEVVPSHLGIDVSVGFFCEKVQHVAEALTDGARLEISAEESWRTGRIIEAELRLAAAGVAVVATVQANLKRSAHDAQRLVEAGIPVRLVKGAYLETTEVAHPWGEPTDLAFIQLAHQIHPGRKGLALATHDRVIRESLLASLEGVGIEMLLGVREEDARDLVRRGHHVRIYVPYGDQWFRYWMRRLAEAQGA